MFNQVKELKSSNENVMKLIFTNPDAVAEAVLYKYPTYEERTVVCCSTQSGCPVGCRFCGTGNFFVRNLKAEEIVYQVDYCIESQNIDSKNIKNFQIVVMSMGEPMLNFKELSSAFIILNKKYPQAKLLISTTAPRVNYQPLMELAQKIDKIGLQFSIHESTDEKRNQLIPYKNKLSLIEIKDIGLDFFANTGRYPFFNYCANNDNSSQSDVNRLVDLFDPKIFQSTISVICEVDESVTASNIRQRELADGFMQKMIKAGYSVRLFDPAGQDDIGGGCGQLWFVQDWLKNNPQYAKKSAGYGLNVVHSPI